MAGSALPSGDGIPMIDVPAPAGVVLQPPPVAAIREDFDGGALPIDFQWLRTPRPEELFSLRTRQGHLRLYGRETIGSLFTQALVARRQQAHCFSASTIVEFEPQHFQQMAGLVCYYNSSKFHYFYISRDEGGKHLRVMSALPDQVTADAFTPPIPVADGVPIELRVDVDYERLHFAYRVGGAPWQWLPRPFDASILSDEATAPGMPNFTGAFVGMACQDLAGTALPADFDWFEYRERDYVADVTSETSAPTTSAESAMTCSRSTTDRGGLMFGVDGFASKSRGALVVARRDGGPARGAGPDSALPAGERAGRRARERSPLAHDARRKGRAARRDLEPQARDPGRAGTFRSGEGTGAHRRRHRPGGASERGCRRSDRRTPHATTRSS